LVDSGRPVLEVARSLGIRADMVRKWRRQFATAAGADEAFPGQGKLPSQDEEIRRLRRELEVARQERDFLKRATVFFAKESR
jgi:transposase